jgi:hypothetical protein
MGELQSLTVQLGVHLHTDEDNAAAILWDAATWRAADLYERALADLGTLSARYVRLKIAEQHGRAPGW